MTALRCLGFPRRICYESEANACKTLPMPFAFNTKPPVLGKVSIQQSSREGKGEDGLGQRYSMLPENSKLPRPRSSRQGWRRHCVILTTEVKPYSDTTHRSGENRGSDVAPTVNTQGFVNKQSAAKQSTSGACIPPGSFTR